MTSGASLPDGDPDDLVVEAALVLRALGASVVPTGDDFALWSVDGGSPETDGDLLARAFAAGLMDGPGRLQ